jgi:hypothetical protein
VRFGARSSDAGHTKADSQSDSLTHTTRQDATIRDGRIQAVFLLPHPLAYRGIRLADVS